MKVMAKATVMETKHHQKAIVNNAKGFTLIEMMISLAIAALVTLMSIPGLLLIQKGGRLSDREASFEENHRALSFALPYYLGQAVNIDWTSGSIGNIGANRGQIRMFTSTLAPTPQNPVAVGVFLREIGRPGNGNSLGELRGTGIYFKNPTPSTEGEIIISSASAPSGSVQLSSDDFDQKFGSIVSLEVRPGGYDSTPGAPVRVVELNIVYRKFLTDDKSQWHWCPASLIQSTPACPNQTSVRDVRKTIEIPLVNNALDTTDIINDAGERRKETLFGNLYFFRFTPVN